MSVRAALLLASATIVSPTWAGDIPLYAPAPAWVTPAPLAATDAADQPALRVFDHQQKLDGDGVWAYFETATHIGSSEMMAQMGTITLPWHPANGDLIIHRAEIVRGAETIDLIAKGARFTVLQREQQLEQQMLTGVLTATMTVEGLRIGDILRLSASITQNDPALQGRVQMGMPLLADPMRAQFGRVRLLWPEKFPARWKGYGEGLNAKQTRHDGMNDVVVALPLVKQPEMPADAPPRFQRPPIIEASSFADWADVSRTVAPLYRTQGLIAPDSPLAAEVARIAAAETDPRRRAAAALRLVQNEVRYLFVGMEQGNYVPQTPDKTWELRYGDCKAKTLLLLALLHALDIDAEAVLANSGLGDWLPERLPSMAAFDHVLVAARIDGEMLWLDGTLIGARLADLGDTPPLRHILPLRPEGATLVPIALRPNGRPDLTTDLELDQSAGIYFPPLFKIRITVRGALAETIKLANAQGGREQIRDAVQSMVVDYVNGGQVITRSLSFDDDAGTATVEATGLANLSWPREDERRRALLDKTIGSTKDFNPDRARDAWQTIPVATGNPISVARHVRLKLPDNGAGFVLEGDEALSETLIGTAIRRTSALKDGWVRFDDEMATAMSEISVAQAVADRERLALALTRRLRVVAPENYPPRWQAIRDAMAQKRVEPILAAYQRAIDDDPAEVSGYSNRANFWAGVYERRRAIADLDEAIKREPSAYFHQWRAGLYDSLGEKDKAIADITAARKLDPGSDGLLAGLADLQSDRGDYETALSLVDGRIAAGGKTKPDFMALKGEILAKQGRFDEALAAMDSAISQSPGNPGLLNRRCWMKGTYNLTLDSALKDCTKAIELAESPFAALDSRAMVYYRMNRLDDALADLDAAYTLNQDVPAMLYMRGVIRKKLGRTAEAEADLAGARMMAPMIDKDYARYAIKP